MPFSVSSTRATRTATGTSRSWQEGDVAFLSQGRFYLAKYPDHEYSKLIKSGVLDEEATGHPCIILKLLPHDRVVVTTVSAFGSGNYNKNKAPWKHLRCYMGRQALFRSFQGCELASRTTKPLKLLPGHQWPKPETSWVNIRSVWAVPMSALGSFTKSKQLLVMTPESLDELRCDVAKRSTNYDPCWNFPGDIKGTPTSPVQNWSGITNNGQPRPMPEAPVTTSCWSPTLNTSCWRPTVNTTTNPLPARTQVHQGTTTSTLQSHTVTVKTPALSTGAPPPKPISWASIAAKSAPGIAPRRTTSVKRTPWVKQKA